VLLSLPQLGLSLIAGVLTTLSPCVFPLLPLVLGGALQLNRLGPLAMGIGMTLSFSLIGMAFGALGPSLDMEGDTVRTAGAAAVVALSLVMLVPAWGERFAQWMLPVATSANAVSARFNSGSLAGALLLGGVLGVVWSPCSGPLLGTALTLVAKEGGVARGGLMLGVFGFGAALPLVAVAYASRSGFMKARQWVLAHSVAVRRVFALVLGASGLAIVTGVDRWVEAAVLQRLPDAWVMLTVSI
jgi:cytochrome c-type biogenesis protein